MDSRTARTISAVLVVALIALAAVLVTRGGDDEPAEEGDAAGWVLVDGWSWAMRGDRALEVLVDGDVIDAEFAPVTEADLAELLELQPTAVTQLAARVATADPSLVCDTGGCTTSDGDLPLSDIAAPRGELLRANGVTHGAYVARVGTEKSITLEVRVAGEERGARLNMRPDLGPPADERPDVATQVPGGEVLTVPPPGAVGEEVSPEELEDLAGELGIDIDLDVEVPDDLGQSPAPSLPAPGALDPEIQIPDMDQTAPGGYGPRPAPADAGADEAVPVDEGTEVRGATQDVGDDAPVEPVLDDGDGPAAEDLRKPLPPVLVAGLAWGKVFPLEVPWLTAEDFPNAGAFGGPRPASEPVEEFTDGPAPFASGLAVDDEAAQVLTSSQLTAWSSPLIGCGIGVVCAPDADGVDITENAPAQVVDLCQVVAAPDGIEIGVGATDLPALTAPVKVVLRDRAMSFDDATRTQLGAWPDDAETPTNSLWPVPAPVSSEAFTVQVRSAEIYDGNGLLTVVGSQGLTAGDGVWDAAALLGSAAGNQLTTCG